MGSVVINIVARVGVKVRVGSDQWFLTFFPPWTPKGRAKKYPRTPKVFKALLVDPYVPLKDV